MYRATQAAPITRRFLAAVFDLGPVPPPRSMLIFAQMFSAPEEILFRGVLLTMFLQRHCARLAIVSSAAAFIFMHLRCTAKPKKMGGRN